jgi:hypothetical protein
MKDGQMRLDAGIKEKRPLKKSRNLRDDAMIAEYELYAVEIVRCYDDASPAWHQKSSESNHELENLLSCISSDV